MSENYIFMGCTDDKGKTRRKKISVFDALCIVANENFHFERIVGSNLNILINEDKTKWFVFESFH